MSSPSSSSLRESIPDFVTPSNIDLENQQEHHGKRRSVEFSPPGDAARTTFELFRTYDGEEYTVYMREDGKKFYVDFEEQVNYTQQLLFAIAGFSCNIYN